MTQTSFIVPAFNEEERLAPCLASIRAQQGEFEIIVVDNNSRDRTAEIARKYADRVVPCGLQGIAAARNQGADCATADVLAFVDADARLQPDWLRRGHRQLAESRLHAVSGLNYFAETNLLRFCLYNTYSIGFVIFLSARALMRRPVVAGNNLLIRRDAFKAVGGFPRFIGEDMKLSEALNRIDSRVGFCPFMRITYSSRRFRRQGFFKVLSLWLSSVVKDLPEDSYAIDYSGKNRS